MRFFCRFKGEEAEYIKRLFDEVGIGGGDSGVSIRQFTKVAVTKELKNLAATLKEYQEKQVEGESSDEK